MTALNRITLHQMLRGRGLKSVERDVLQAMASYGDYDLTKVKPGLGTVARDYGLDIRTVRNTVHGLTAKGYLEVVQLGGGRCNPTEYRVVEPSETPASHGSVSGGDAVQEPSHPVQETPTSHALNTPVPCAKPPHPTGGDQSFTSSSPVKTPVPPTDGFKAFFEAYPKQVGESKAKAAYDQTVNNSTDADPETLLECAKSYRAKCLAEGTLDRFVAWPANWLSDGRWRGYVTVTVEDEYGNKRQMTKAEADDRIAAAQRPKEWHFGDEKHTYDYDDQGPVQPPTRLPQPSSSTD